MLDQRPVGGSAITLFDFDGSVSRQSRLMTRLCDRIRRVDLSGYARSARLWSSPGLFGDIERRHFRQTSPGLAFLGSGDFHHFSLPLLASTDSPFTLVLFDNHPDWMRPPHRYHCGSWVFSAARLPQVSRIVIIGLESGDLAGKSFRNGDLESYFNGKIRLLPTKAITALGPDGPLTLPACMANGESAAIEKILEAIPEGQVYISLDKDCLRQEDAATNWEQGTLSLSFVLRAIDVIGQRHRVVGADTVGDASPPRFHSPLKWLGSIIDRPRQATEFKVDQAGMERNESANLALVNCLDRYL